MKRVAVIGAGPAGLTAAYELCRKGFAVEVFEASPHVGGMARSFELWGVQVDLGPHRFFTQDRRVNDFWLDLAGTDYELVDRLTRIHYRGKFYDYPLRGANALGNLGWIEAAHCGWSYATEKLRDLLDHEPPENFEAWVVSAFGRRLYELFFQSYSEKLWGIPCRDLDVDFAAQRIQRFSLGRAVLAALGWERGQHKTLAQRFAHPIDGCGMIYARMAQRIREAGGKIYLSTPVSRLTDDGRGVQLKDGTEHHCDHVISTMPLTLLCQGLPHLPDHIRTALDQLTYRHTILVYLRVEHDALFPDQWLYMQTPEIRLGRVTNFRNWPSGRRDPSGTSILALEYWCNATDDLWTMENEALIALGQRELAQTGLLCGAPIAAGHVIRIPRCYPVYRKGYHQWLEPVITHLKNHCPQIVAIGRYGSFKYNNQDHSILMGLLAAENIADHAGHDLWGINTDYGVYQESARQTLAQSSGIDG
jgi:protoporphyrinogen oxidase